MAHRNVFSVGILLILASMTTFTTASSPTAAAQSKLRRYILARHGETNFNKEKREQGTLDTSVLTFDGISQAAALGVYIARRQAGEILEPYFGDGNEDGSTELVLAPPITRTWCSPLIRCRQTYAAISGCSSSYAKNGRPLPEPTIHSNLREIELCEWQGRLTQEIMEQDANNWNTFKANPHMLRLNNGRFAPVVDCWERGLANWNAIQKDAAAEDNDVTFILCHGGMGQCMLLQALGINIDMFRKSKDYAFDNCGCIEIEWADGEECSRRWRRLHPTATEWQSTSASRRMGSGEDVSVL